MIAVVSPSSRSTSGRAIVGMKPCTKALYVSLISRCDSAAIVSNTSELLPEPETPVNTHNRRFGISTLMSLRLFSRAPPTRINSWLSATSCAGDFFFAGDFFRAGDFFFLVVVLIVAPWLRSPGGSAQLLDADQVACGIADGAVANPVRLVGRLLYDLGVAAGLHPLESGVE